MTESSPDRSFARGEAVCHLYAHANGEETLLLDMPGDGTFSIGWTSISAERNLEGRGWTDGGGEIPPALRKIVAERLATVRERPSDILKRLLDQRDA